MEVDRSILSNIANCLLATLNPQTQKLAERQLISFESSIPNFPSILLSLTISANNIRDGIPVNVDVPSVLLLKNMIKNHWADIDSNIFNYDSRQAIKRDVLLSLSQTSFNVRNQLSEIICIISQNDFPENWPDLLNKLLEKIDSSDFYANIVLLKTCHKIFKRYRLEERSDDLYREINFVMSKFGPALLKIYVGIENMLKAGINEKNMLGLVLENATYANKIFYSLSFQDIPEFIEDNLKIFMNILMFLYNFQSPFLLSESDEQPGIIEKLTTSVAKIVILYTSKFEEDFTMLDDFTQATWTILTSRVTLLPRDDKLTCTCIGFLASVARQERHKSIFQNFLQIICEKIIIPNMKIRESDLEIFEDDPIEFIRRDSEGGSDLSHRHSSAVSLIQGLMEFNEIEMTKILFETITRCLSEYLSDPSKYWKSKLLATQIFSAIGARGYAEAFGVTIINSNLNVKEYFHTHVLPDLKTNNCNLHPLLLLEAIKFVMNYRNQLVKNELVECMPLMLFHLESENFIIHTYSAITIEKILAIKREGEALFNSADISDVVGRISLNILTLIFNQKSVEKMCENYFLIKAFVRVLGLASYSDVDSIFSKFSDKFFWLLAEIIKNPMNPLFNHYFFESFALIILSSSSFPETFNRLEVKIVPYLFNILQSEQSDLFSYAFQLMTVIVESNYRTEMPEYIKSLLPAVLQPNLWSTSCNIPGLVRLLQSCLYKNPDFFLTTQHIESIIAIFRILVNSKLNESHGFNLIMALFGIMPPELLEKYIRPVFLLILARVQVYKAQKLNSHFLLFICFLVVETKISDGAKFVLRALQQIQPNIYVMLFKSLFIPVISKIQEPSDKKIVGLGIIELLVELKYLLGGSSDDVLLWFTVFIEVLKTSNFSATMMSNSFAVDYLDDISTIQGSFNRLISVPKFRKYSKIISLPEIDLRILQFIKTLLHDSIPNFKELLSDRLDERSKSQLEFLLQKYNTSI